MGKVVGTYKYNKMHFIEFYNVKVNFIYQPFLSFGYRDIWLTIVSGCIDERVFRRDYICISRLSKAVCFCNPYDPYSIYSELEQNTKAKKGRIISTYEGWSWNINLRPPSECDLYHRCFWFSVPQAQSGTTSTTLEGSPPYG